MSATSGKRHCVQCGREVEAEIRKTICANGAALYYWTCMESPRKHRTDGSGVNIRHGALVASGIDPATIPELKSNIGHLKCAVKGCKNLGVDRHHWAPVVFFGRDEAELWPASWLCVEHHVAWHQVMDAAIKHPKRSRR